MPAHNHARNGRGIGLHVLPSRDQRPAGTRTIAGTVERSVRRLGVFADLRDQIVLESHLLDEIQLRLEPVDVLF
jgi:hypothetical protein